MWGMVAAAGGIMAVTGVLFGLGLAVAGKRLAVEEDPSLQAVMDALPNANCGACGFSGCRGFAAALVHGEAGAGGCKAGGESVAKKLGEIVGADADAGPRMVARVMCSGGDGVVHVRGEYTGIRDCWAAHLEGGSDRACPYGCLGFGNCVEACPFGALSMGPNGLPVVNEAICTGCGICVHACPRALIELQPADQTTYVRCRSLASGKAVRAVCDAGCIACKICERTCEHDAIHVVDLLARVDPERCDSCGKCAQKCPTHVIAWTPEGAVVVGAAGEGGLCAGTG